MAIEIKEMIIATDIRFVMFFMELFSKIEDD